MKENTRRIVLFAIIVITGSVMILFDVPLIIMIPLVIVVGFIILLVTGAVSLADIKSSLARPKPGGTPKPSGTPAVPKKGGLFDRLKHLSLSKNKESGSAQSPSKPVKTPEKKEPAKIPEKSGGLRGHFSSIITSFRSIGTVLQERSKRQRKVGEINTQLDKTVSEKIEKPAAPTPLPPPVGGAGSSAAPSGDADPFLSLSEDEFDPGLLDGLGDQDFAAPPTGLNAAGSDGDLPDPTMDIDAASNAILQAQEPNSPDEFSGLDGGDSLDTDFGDLDNISLDDMDMDGDLDGDLPDMQDTPAPEAVAAPASAPASPQQDAAQSAVKTAWIPSDAPKGADQVEDQISTQSDMAAFASGSTNDEDMLSSLASDVKRIEKKVDISLVRELKDFKAPANEIEKELDDMYQKISSVKNTQAKKIETTPKNGMK